MYYVVQRTFRYNKIVNMQMTKFKKRPLKREKKKFKKRIIVVFCLRNITDSINLLVQMGE